MKHVFAALALIALALPLANAQHYALGPDWVAGEGVYVITQDGDNRVLTAAALNNNDPKHAWVDVDFGEAYGVRCDIRMDTWADGEDLSRAGIAVHIQPDGTAPDGGGDRGINLLLHNTIGNIEYLNDLRAWATDEAFAWEPRVWYTMEINSDGTTVTGSITEVGNPENTLELAPWDFPDPQNRQGGFAGVTASTLGGLQASFDNFEVIVGGEVVYSDDFEGTEPVGNTVGLSPDWVGGQAGYYVVDGGQMYAIATNATDPKHAWYAGELVGGGSITGEVTMLSWEDEDDFSRAGLALHIQPDGTAPDGGGDRAINLLFHENLNNVEFLNDLRAWATDEAFAWSVGTPYLFSMSSDGTTVTGTISELANPDNFIELAPWAFPDPQNRADGFAGVTGSTSAGLIAAYDNIEIADASGNMVYTDDFETFYEGPSAAGNWELYR